MPTKPLRIAHLSDLHCHRLSFNPLQLLSKRWLGNFNLLFNRQCHFYKDPPSLVPWLKSLDVSHLVISGDLSTTAQGAEFAAAKALIDDAHAERITSHIVPGNHDMYTRSAYRKKLFYQFFADEQLRDKRLAVHPLANGWWWVGLDTSLATHLLASTGLFPKALEETLEATLREIPKGDQVVLCNHFPLFPTRRRSHRLRRSEVLRAILSRYPCVRLYLHGHIHRQSFRDARGERLPIVVNSGSCGMTKGKASLNIIDLQDDECTVHAYKQSVKGEWSLSMSSRFSWSAAK